MNYADIVIGAILALGFLKGFLAGFWSSVLGLAGTVVGFLGAYFFTGPAVNYLEKSARWVSHVAEWWKDVFVLFPATQNHTMPIPWQTSSRELIPLPGSAHFKPS